MRRVWVPQALAAVALVWAFNPENPYGYYVLLRWICFGVFGYLAVQAYRAGSHAWPWILGITAGVYNPFFRVHLDRGIWSVVNAATIGIALVSVFSLRIGASGDQDSN